jgi:uncharacterized protein (DUF1778 family)
MPRYAKSYEGEKRTSRLPIKLTASERARLEEAANRAGATNLSQYVRELCLRRGGAAQIVAKTRRNPAALKLVNELAAIGNNLNQLSRHCNTVRAAPQLDELKETTEKLKAALSHVLAI